MTRKKIAKCIAIVITTFAIVNVTARLVSPNFAFAQAQPVAFPEEDTPAAEAQARDALTADPLKNPGTRFLSGVTLPTPNVSCWTDVACHMLKFVNWVVDALFYPLFLLVEYFFTWMIGINFAPFSVGSPTAFAVNAGF